MAETDYPFNDELLLSQEDRDHAAALYPHIYPALNHEALRNLFLTIDDAANAAKRRSRRWGILAVILVACALCAAAAEPLYHGSAAAMSIAVVSGAAGIAGALLGFFGILFAGSKRAWLEGRLLTERMRQFHFQSMIAWAPDILSAAKRGKWDAFDRKRAAQFERFQQDIVAVAGTKYDAIIDQPRQGAWLVPRPGNLDVNDFAHVDELAGAYQNLRINRQIRFTEYKLRPSRKLFPSFPIAQAARLSGAALICVLGLIALHIAVVVGIFAPLNERVMTALHVGAIWLAVIALALRTLEEGLQPNREVLRYRSYQTGLVAIQLRFNQAPDQTGRMMAMVELEELSFDEMVTFLKSNDEARFVM